MNNVTIEAFRIDPDTVAILQARARRARAQAMHSLILRLLERLTARPNSRRWGLHWG